MVDKTFAGLVAVLVTAVILLSLIITDVDTGSSSPGSSVSLRGSRVNVQVM